MPDCCGFLVNFRPDYQYLYSIRMWDPNYGPDWIDKLASACVGLEAWKKKILSKPESGNIGSPSFCVHEPIGFKNKSSILILNQQYNCMMQQGLFNLAYVIGQSYSLGVKELSALGRTRAPVFIYKDGSLKVYLVICAQRPAGWLFQEDNGEIAKDVRSAGFLTTLGHA
ncbi:hypothetical protein OBBRIDRAFT_802142 [Obba rivulosa]|uniref:Uncharacterized protein n=1 Tax=Obba rivulosa TaxID=1052685 RepID=A0A8E2B3Q8_9APHY|nr:hypothetical protein OBBRIDRAFT_802142 [Obba rivulosa]